MAKLPIKRGSHRGIGRIYGFRPVNAVASRVMGRRKNDPILDPKELRERAERTTNQKKKQALLMEAERAEKKRRAAANRMIGTKAEERARRALEAAKRHRENPKD